MWRAGPWELGLATEGNRVGDAGAQLGSSEWSLGRRAPKATVSLGCSTSDLAGWHTFRVEFG